MRGFRALWVLPVFLVACVGPAPQRDYALAYTAYEAAKKVEAPRVSPGYFAKGEDYYKRAILDYEAREYSAAQDKFKKAKLFFERAENYTAIKKAEQGEVQ